MGLYFENLKTTAKRKFAGQVTAQAKETRIALEERWPRIVDAHELRAAISELDMARSDATDELEKWYHVPWYKAFNDAYVFSSSACEQVLIQPVMTAPWRSLIRPLSL